MKKDICLVRPLISPNEMSGFPVELLILATCLRSHGYRVSINDYDFMKEIDVTWKKKGNFAKRAALDVVNTGCTYVGITTMCSNYVLAADLAYEIKRLNPNIHITFGGPQATMCPKETLEQYPQIDTVVIGEGEVTYLELINRLELGQPLEGVLGVA